MGYHFFLQYPTLIEFVFLSISPVYIICFPQNVTLKLYLTLIYLLFGQILINVLDKWGIFTFQTIIWKLDFSACIVWGYGFLWVFAQEWDCKVMCTPMFIAALFTISREMATRSSTLAWRNPWMEEPGGLQSMRSLWVGHDWATSLSCIGEGNGSPLQCSWLENPRDGGTWWAAVYEVAQSQIRLKQFGSSSSSSRTCKQPKCPSAEEWIKMWYKLVNIYSGCYPAIKRTKLYHLQRHEWA